MHVFAIVVTVWKTVFRDEQPGRMTLIHPVFAIVLTVWKTGFKDEQKKENDSHTCMSLQSLEQYGRQASGMNNQGE